MPRTATDYSNTIIYKIQSIDNPELLYVGSTTDFTKRKSAHKSDCNNPNYRCYNLKLYKMIRDNGGWDMFNMVIVKEFPCENKRQAECEEDRCIREMKADLNSQRAFVTPEDIVEYNKQYRTEHKEHLAEKRKQYVQLNKETITEKRKQYVKLNKETIAEYQLQYRLEHKEELAIKDKQRKERNKNNIAERGKIYRIEHKDEIAERGKIYRTEHKDEIAERKKQKITCDCGCVVTKVHLARHKRTKNHQDLMKSIEQ